VRNAFFEVARINGCKGLAGSLSRVVDGNLVVLQPKHHVIEDRRCNELRVGILKDEPDFPACTGFVAASNSLAGHAELTFIGRERCVQVFEQRRLSRAVATHQCDDLVSVDGELDVVHPNGPVRIGMSFTPERDERIAVVPSTLFGAPVTIATDAIRTLSHTDTTS
jgi:hypothetical protein